MSTTKTYAQVTSSGCRLAPKMIPSPESVPFELYRTQEHTTLNSTHFSCFWNVENPQRKNSEIFHWCTHTETDSHLLFQKWSKLVQDKWLKGCVALKTKKHVLAPLGRTAGAISPIFSCERAPWRLTCSAGFIQISSGLGKL